VQSNTSVVAKRETQLSLVEISDLGFPDSKITYRSRVHSVRVCSSYEPSCPRIIHLKPRKQRHPKPSVLFWVSRSYHIRLRASGDQTAAEKLLTPGLISICQPSNVISQEQHRSANSMPMFWLLRRKEIRSNFLPRSSELAVIFQRLRTYALARQGWTRLGYSKLYLSTSIWGIWSCIFGKLKAPMQIAPKVHCS
jgi:hypothetical protein